MHDITVTKADLLEILRENRTKHRAVFEAAMEGFAAAARARLEDELRQMRTGPVRDIKILLNRPQDHTDDYDLVIRMVELHTGTVIVLTESDVMQYIRDDWMWRRDWNRRASTYAGATYTENYGRYEDN